MPFDGSGTFNRVMNWVNDAAANIKIKADRHDAEDDNFAAGLSNALTKDGQTQPTANIPMNGKKLVNLGAPTAGTDAATKAYVDGASPPRLGPSATVITDWNTALTNGWYSGNGAANAPPSSITGTTLWVWGRVESFGTGYVVQTVWPASQAVADADTKTAMRVQSNGVWSAWFRLRFSETEMNGLYARKDAANTFAGVITFGSTPVIAGAGPMLFLQDTDAGAYDFWLHANGNTLYILCDRNNDGAWDGQHPLMLDAVNSVGYTFGQKIWTQGNDGAGSGLDADLLDGLNSYSAAGAANTIAARDTQGDISVRLLRSEYPSDGAALGNYFLAMNAVGTTAAGADNYARPMPLANAAAKLGDEMAASGSLQGGQAINTWVLNTYGKDILIKFTGGSGTFAINLSPDGGTNVFTLQTGLSANGGVGWVPQGYYFKVNTAATNYNMYTFR